MKRSTEIEKLIRDTVAAYQRGDVAFIEQTTSKLPGVVVIGTDANEYSRDHEAIVRSLRDEIGGESSPIRLQIGDLHAYEHGDVGWADGTGYFESDGKTVEVRSTGVFLREAGQWRAVQSHGSIGVPNARMFDPLFQRQGTAP